MSVRSKLESSLLWFNSSHLRTGQTKPLLHKAKNTQTVATTFSFQQGFQAMPKGGSLSQAWGPKLQPFGSWNHSPSEGSWPAPSAGPPCLSLMPRRPHTCSTLGPWTGWICWCMHSTADVCNRNRTTKSGWKQEAWALLFPWDRFLVGHVVSTVGLQARKGWFWI